MRVIRAILWILGSFLASKIVGNFVYEVLNEPSDGVNLVNAFIPAAFSAFIFSFGIYKAFFDKRKTDESKEENFISDANHSDKNSGLEVSSAEEARHAFNDSFDSNKTKFTNNFTNEIMEDVLWEQALNEFDEGSTNRGLWAKCFSEANGNEAVAKAIYLKLRVNQLNVAKISKQSVYSLSSDDYSSMSIRSLLEKNLYIKKSYKNKELLYFKNANVGCVIGSVIRVFENEKFCKKAIESGDIGQRVNGLIVSINKNTFEIS